MNTHIDQAVKVLQDGGIIVFPTDTAFGIGCLMNKTESIKRLFTLRRRPETQATPVLMESERMVANYVTAIPQRVRTELMEKYWPGALTIILEAQTEKVPQLVRGGTSTIGVRVPNHDIPLSILKKVGIPLLGPSANFHGEETPYTFSSLNPELIKLVDFVVEGECTVKTHSTVIDTTKDPWKIVREGGVTITQLL